MIRRSLLLAAAVAAMPGLAPAQTSIEAARGAAVVPIAQASTPRAAVGALEQLRAFVAGTPAASGRFEQIGGGESAQDRQSGSFGFARPGRFRWAVDRPYPQLLVADGEQVFFHDPDLNQVTVRPATEALGATPAAILFGQGDLDQSFELSELGSVDGVAWLDAVPRTRDAGFERIRIGFSDGLPVRMDVDDAFGRSLAFAFSEIRRQAPDSASFRFEIPPGADVVRQ